MSIIRVNTVTDMFATIEAMDLKLVGNKLVVNNQHYFHYDEADYDEFLRRAGYEEVELDELPDRVLTKYVKNDESLQAYAYFMRTEWISINERISMYNECISNLQSLKS